VFNETGLGESYGQLVSLAQGAGCSASAAQIAAAVAMAESGGRAGAHNPVPPDNSYGLWQINMIGALGPERRRQFGISRNEDLWNAATNARAMYAVSGGCSRWSPWTTYTSGAYKQFLQSAAPAPAPVGGSSVPTGSADGGGFEVPSVTTEILQTPFLSGLPPLAIIGALAVGAWLILR
jgi:hypothetical protein